MPKQFSVSQLMLKLMIPVAILDIFFELYGNYGLSSMFAANGLSFQLSTFWLPLIPYLVFDCLIIWCAFKNKFWILLLYPFFAGNLPVAIEDLMDPHTRMGFRSDSHTIFLAGGEITMVLINLLALICALSYGIEHLWPKVKDHFVSI